MTSKAAGIRGEYAGGPGSIPFRGWREVLLRVVRQTSDDNLSLVSAGIAFYGLLAIFPALAMLVTIYGLVTDPGDLARQLEILRGVVPKGAFDILGTQLTRIVQGNEAELGIGLALSFALALWSATKGSKALMAAMNIAYNEKERRGLVLSNVIAIGFTAGAALFVIISFAAIAAIPAAVELLAVPEPIASALLWLRWIVMALAVIIALTAFYRFAPSRRAARLKWIMPGAVAAMGLWLVASIAFSLYVANFDSYNATFGSLGAVVTLLMWFYLSAYVICLGAELNAELEQQTYVDSTVGPSRPAGQRGAYVADHTAEPGQSEQTGA